MKVMSFLALVIFLLSGCDLVNTKSTWKLIPTFTLTDTTGQVRKIFHPGENFVMSYSVINTTSFTLDYYNTKPPVIFQVIKNDSVIASSIDGYAFAEVVRGGYLMPYGVLKATWKAPTTPPQYPKVILSPGSYEARVVFVGFNQVKVESVPGITILVLR